MVLERFLQKAADPGPEYGVVPFWFWNDDLDEAELLRQLRAMRDGGVGGVLIHPRVGLSRRVGYLTPEFFHLVRWVAEEAAALGLKVVLYDEGSYPSGSACGRVVAENPEYAARALILVQREQVGPWRGYWRPSAGRALVNRLVCAVVGRLTPEGRVDPTTLQVLEPLDHNLCRVDVGEGQWKLMACFDVPSGGTIRGVLPEEEDGCATAPPAGDLMNPEAVTAFIRLTHDAYLAHLGDLFGTTVVAMFTDEPSPLGRGARRDAQPYAPGLVEGVAWLPALWLDYGPGTAEFRQRYEAAVHQRVVDVFYGAQADWCEEHGIILTGHPDRSNDMSSLERFGWPGQDMVWRYVVPGDDTALVGPHSVAPKAAVSAGRAAGRRRVVTELFGAYGWTLSLDEAKWLLDWHLARGVNMFMPHAFFYSLRDGRAFESEPDVGLQHPSWHHWQEMYRYTARMSWLLTDCEHVCDVAVLGQGRSLPWEAARRLYEKQVDFLYIDADALERAAIVDRRLVVGTQAYRTVLVDGAPELTAGGAAVLSAFEAAGGRVVRSGLTASTDVVVKPPAPGLRVIHVRKAGVDAYAFFNEGEEPVRASIRVAAEGAALWWDPFRGTSCPAGPLELGRRECRVLLVDPASGAAAASPFTDSAGATVDLVDGWSPSLGDWTRSHELERFAGTVTYRCTVELGHRVQGASLDFGQVGEAAAVIVNGVPVGSALWAPYVVPIPNAVWRAGENLLEVRVTNSPANRYEGVMLPSGLMGPVRLRYANEGDC